MKKSIALSALLITGCAVPPSATPNGPRTIVLHGENYSEADLGEFISWHCSDYINRGRTLVEVGIFSNHTLSDFGFVLYDGGYSGDSTSYQRRGINQRWDWGPNGSEYTFVIEPDGTGLFYDFSSIPDGESTKANAVYKCNRI